jgi:hypothetical protein
MHKKTWVALACAGVLAGGVVGAQPPKSEHSPSAPSAGLTTVPAAPAVEAPKSGVDALTTMLTDSRTALGQLRDYTCTFTRQELRTGALSGEEVAELKVRTSPAGVYARFAKGPDTIAGMEVAFSAARKNGKMRYRPAGAAGSKGFHSLDVDDTKFMASNRHPVTDWTMVALLDHVATALAREKTLNNPVEVYTSDYQFAGRNVVRYEILTRRQHAFRTAYRMLVYVDKQTKLPLRFEAYDQPKSGATVGDLIEAYSFSDVKTNVGLGEGAFDY